MHWIRAATLLFLWGAAVPSAAFALSARALIDRTEASVEDGLVLTVVVSGGSGEVDTSAVTDFSVAERGTSSSVQIVNAQVTREIRRRYLLTPRRAGELTIPALAVRDGSTVVRTEPIAVRVRERSSIRDEERDLDVTAEVSPSAAYAGQEIVYTLRFSASVPVARAGLTEPSFAGFAAKKLEDQQAYSSVRNGREYRIFEVSYLLVPQREGLLEIEPGAITCEVQDRRSRRPRSPFDDSFFGQVETVQRTLRSNPVQVKVSALPPYAGQRSFSGLIGKFALAATLDPPELTSGDSATLTVKVQGSGNVQDAPPPELSVLRSVKVYPDEPSVEVNRGANGTRGTKTFRFALVPTEPGAVSLGPVELTAFDPTAGDYVTLASRLPELKVKPSEEAQKAALAAPGSATSNDESPGSEPKKAVRQTGRDILSVRRDLDALVTRTEMAPLNFAIWLLVPALAFGALAVAKRRRQPGPGELMASKAIQSVAQAQRLAGAPNQDDFLAALSRALFSAALARMGRTGEFVTQQEALEGLRASGVSAPLAQQAAALLGRVDSARYGGASLGEGGQKALLEEVHRAVRELAKGGRA